MSHDPLFGPSSAYEHNGDKALMERLGLHTGPFGREWTDLGTVTVEEAQTENEYRCPTGPRPAATVKCEVSALPAQFFRFTITRPQDETVDDDSPEGFHAVYEPVERFVVTTGSGSFSEYWKTAEAIARNMIEVERA